MLHLPIKENGHCTGNSCKKVSNTNNKCEEAIICSDKAIQRWTIAAIDKEHEKFGVELKRESIKRNEAIYKLNDKIMELQQKHTVAINVILDEDLMEQHYADSVKSNMNTTEKKAETEKIICYSSTYETYKCNVFIGRTESCSFDVTNNWKEKAVCLYKSQL